MRMSNRPDILARLARSDVNMPDFDGFPLDVQISDVKFEAATYQLLQAVPNVRASRLLHHRLPVQYDALRLTLPLDLFGRRLMVFERAQGDKSVRLYGEEQVTLGHDLDLSYDADSLSTESAVS